MAKDVHCYDISEDQGCFEGIHGGEGAGQWNITADYGSRYGAIVTRKSNARNWIFPFGITEKTVTKPTGTEVVIGNLELGFC